MSLLLLVGAGCGYKTPSPEPSPARPTEEVSGSIDGTWKLKRFKASGKETQDVSKIGSTLTIEAGTRLSARICNSMSGEYNIESGTLKVSILLSTKMFCTGLPGEIETAFSQGLSTGLKIDLSSEVLVLRAGAGAEFTYERSEDPRVGTPADEETAAEDRVVSGTVVSIDTDQVPVDGPAVVNLRTSSGAMAKILVPSFGLGLCKAKASIADVYTLKAGDRVEANGSLGVDGAIIPCQSEAHYLRVTTK
ncbi:MAG: META domain-containing protein [Patescibacteria group bacterium]